MQIWDFFPQSSQFSQSFHDPQFHTMSMYEEIDIHRKEPSPDFFYIVFYFDIKIYHPLCINISINLNTSMVSGTIWVQSINMVQQPYWALINYCHNKNNIIIPKLVPRELCRSYLILKKEKLASSAKWTLELCTKIHGKIFYFLKKSRKRTLKFQFMVSKYKHLYLPNVSFHHVQRILDISHRSIRYGRVTMKNTLAAMIL